MTNYAMKLGRWVRRGAWALVGVSMVVVTAGCGGSQDTATDPTPSATATSAPVIASPSPSPGGPVPAEMVKPTGVLTPEQEAVLVAYQAYWQKCVPAADRDPDQGVERLRECATQEVAEVRGKALRQMKADGLVGFGAPILHPQPPVIEKDNFAIVHDCLDKRQYGEIRASDGTIAVRGIEHSSYETALIKEGGTWKFAGGNEPESGNLAEYCS